MGIDRLQTRDEGDVVEDPSSCRRENRGPPASTEGAPKRIAPAQQATWKIAHGPLPPKRSVECRRENLADEKERPVPREREDAPADNEEEDGHAEGRGSGETAVDGGRSHDRGQAEERKSKHRPEKKDGNSGECRKDSRARNARASMRYWRAIAAAPPPGMTRPTEFPASWESETGSRLRVPRAMR